NKNFSSVLSYDLSTSAGQAAYVTEGMVYISDTAGTCSGYQYFFIEVSVSVASSSAILNADDSDKDWNLARHENFCIEGVTSVPSTITQGRLVMVDTGTSDDGYMYGCDQSAWTNSNANWFEPDGASENSLT